jgi:hypothetical protein
MACPENAETGVIAASSHGHLACAPSDNPSFVDLWRIEGSRAVGRLEYESSEVVRDRRSLVPEQNSSLISDQVQGR